MSEHGFSISNLTGLLRPGFKWVLLFGLWAGLLSCAQKPKTSLPPPMEEQFTQQKSDWEALPKNPQLTQVEEMLSQLTPEEKVGQLLVIGFSGKHLTPKTKRLLQRIKPGSVILFSRNIKNYRQLRGLTDELQHQSQKFSHLPLFIMVDEEGGVVTRIKVGTTLPSALSLAQTRRPQFIRKYSKTLGALLNRLGINMNLAPVLDVSDPNAASFIGSRSFGQFPEEVAELGVAFARGQWDSGIIPTAKHFPGHGGLKTDSHKVTPMKKLTLPELLNADVRPFHSFAKLSFPTAMMLGHVSFPRIDETGYPAAFSKKLNHQLLRENLHFNGLAVTDDLEMAGAEKVGSIPERTIQAILAGNDMIMVAWSEDRQIEAYDTLVSAVKSGRISEQRLNQSLKRILLAKLLSAERSKSYEPEKVNELRKTLASQAKEVKRLSFQSSLRMEEQKRPLPPIPDLINVYSSDRRFFQNFKRSFLKGSRWISLSKGNVERRIVDLNIQSEARPFIFYVSGTGTARWLDQLNPIQKSVAIVINTNQPGAIKNPSDFLKVVQLNSSSPESGAWLAEYLNQSHALRKPSGAKEAVRLEKQPGT